MSLLANIQRRARLWGYERTSRYLRRADSRALIARSEERALRAFHRAARTVPAYHQLLKERGVEANSVRTIHDFKQRVPVIDKHSVFGRHALRDLCVGGTLHSACSFYASSGSTGRFSYGLDTPRSRRRAGAALAFALHHHFDAFQRTTLVLNCLPTGVSVPVQGLPVASTSVRGDIICALIQQLRHDFQQFILVGEHPFLKKAIEDGVRVGVPWKQLVVHVVSGAEYIAESFRTYLASLLGIDFDHPESGMFAVNYGLSELSLSLFSECANTLRIRRLAQSDGAFRHRLYGHDNAILPNVMQYVPLQTYVEALPDADGRSELVVTLLDPALKVPLIRYNTNDVVQLFSYDRLHALLQDVGREDLLPTFRLPLGLVWGKLRGHALRDGSTVYAEQIKEVLYSRRTLAAKVTGSFRLTEDSDTPVLRIQLQPGAVTTPDDTVLMGEIRRITGTSLQVRFMPYNEYPYEMGHDYERKSRYWEPPSRL